MDKTLQILIVEDEAITAENLKQTLTSLGYGISGVVSNATDAIDILLNANVDLAILDINIQGSKNGIWIANYIKKTIGIPYIFLTAYGDEKTIIEATATRPYGYLLKPFVKQNLLVAIQVAIRNFAEDTKNTSNNSFKENDEAMTAKSNIYIKQNGIYSKLLLEDICYIESDKNYVELVLKESKYLVRSTLKDFKEVLPNYFIQIHRSFIVNSSKIDTIKPLNIVIENYTIPLGNSYKEELFRKINTL